MERFILINRFKSERFESLSNNKTKFGVLDYPNIAIFKLVSRMIGSKEIGEKVFGFLTKIC